VSLGNCARCIDTTLQNIDTHRFHSLSSAVPNILVQKKLIKKKKIYEMFKKKKFFFCKKKKKIQIELTKTRTLTKK
jgi:sulfur relay (sulfurtransferase) DsrF/TusC family protein